MLRPIDKAGNSAKTSEDPEILRFVRKYAPVIIPQLLDLSIQFFRDMGKEEKFFRSRHLHFDRRQGTIGSRRREGAVSYE